MREPVPEHRRGQMVAMMAALPGVPEGEIVHLYRVRSNLGRVDHQTLEAAYRTLFDYASKLCADRK